MFSKGFSYISFVGTFKNARITFKMSLYLKVVQSNNVRRELKDPLPYPTWT